jgi:hypothetical protein
MLKLQTKFYVVKMSQYSANQHSTQTTLKSIAFKQNLERLEQRLSHNDKMKSTFKVLN